MNLFQEMISLWYVNPFASLDRSKKEFEVNSLIFSDSVKKMLQYSHVKNNPTR
jgi:hypothetical protein